MLESECPSLAPPRYLRKPGARQSVESSAFDYLRSELSALPTDLEPRSVRSEKYAEQTGATFIGMLSGKYCDSC